MDNTNWMLPDGVDEILMPEAWALEQLRREILNHYWRCGYDLVHPPQIEYIESLLVGTGREFDLQTFKLVDQLTGRTLGFRADMTPQVARIDAHRLKKNHPVRLCYLGTVLRTRPDGFAGGRSPLQLGAEIYGHKGVESDCEILGLMLETLTLAGVKNIYLDIGHVGIFQGLANQAELDDAQKQTLFEMMQRKAKAEIDVYLDSLKCAAHIKRQLASLIELNGDDSILDKAVEMLSEGNTQTSEALDYLQRLSKLVATRYPATTVHFDLAELRGYHYHTGVVFAAYQYGQGQEIARGGRYDDIGKAFGRARPATGFSTDLKLLASRAVNQHAEENNNEKSNAIFASVESQNDSWHSIQAARAAGNRVVCELPGQSGDAESMNCKREFSISENFDAKKTGKF